MRRHSYPLSGEYQRLIRSGPLSDSVQHQIQPLPNKADRPLSRTRHTITSLNKRHQVSEPRNPRCQIQLASVATRLSRLQIASHSRLRGSETVRRGPEPPPATRSTKKKKPHLTPPQPIPHSTPSCQPTNPGTTAVRALLQFKSLRAVCRRRGGWWEGSLPTTLPRCEQEVEPLILNGYIYIIVCPHYKTPGQRSQSCDPKRLASRNPKVKK